MPKKNPAAPSAIKFNLYGVMNFGVAAEDSDIHLSIEAKPDIEIDLIAAAFKAWGYTANDTGAFRAVLKDTTLREEFDKLLRKAMAQEIIKT